ncbi:hypothetical protein [Sporocytophaga myxococcoides]|nr:hypothetical protein [Sporocytophaga myxococcoides]
MTIAGILFCKIAFELDKETHTLTPPKNTQSNYGSKVFFILSGFMGLVLFKIFQDYPMNPAISDIIPAVTE